MTTSTKTSRETLIEEVRRLKDENAAEHGYDPQAIGEAARRHQQEHPWRIVSRENPSAEQDGETNPTPDRQK